MKKSNKKGFSGLEFLIISSICGVFACILLSIAFSTANKERIKSMKYKAEIFKNNVEAYSIISHISEGRVFLWELIDNDIINELSSPFSEKNDCDINNSYIDIKNNKYIVTLKCDEYLIYNSNLSDKKIKIYSVSNWKKKKPCNDDTIDTEVLYNYKKDNKKVLKEEVTEELLLKKYNNNEKTEYKSIYDIKQDDIKIYGQKYYRTRKAIIEI